MRRTTTIILKNVKSEETIDHIIPKVIAKIMPGEKLCTRAISLNTDETRASTPIAIIGETSIPIRFVILNFRNKPSHGSQICASKRPKVLCAIEGTHVINIRTRHMSEYSEINEPSEPTIKNKKSMHKIYCKNTNLARL